MKVVILKVDDWTALYIDGEKIEENHSLNESFVLEAIAKRTDVIDFENHYAELDQDYIESGMVYYPDKLSEVEPLLRGPIEA